jgi:geranylgeranyl pyrophosphate synthase
MKLIPLLEPIRPQLERVERLLHETLARVEEPISSRLRRSLDGGKRLRPALVILAGRMFTSPTEPFYTLAAAVDMLHTATLIHDDLLDGASLRRGRETLHTVWPAGATVLAGDYLLGQAISLIAELEHPRVFKIFGETLCTLCAGEIRRMVVTRGEHRREDYYRSIEAKTASLFAASTEMAGVLAGAGEIQISALRRFGRELGMAFQMVDDVLDFIGDEAQLGKPAGSDFRQGLITLPILYYLERVEDHGPVHAVLSGQRDEEHLRAAIEAVRSSVAIEASLVEARAYARRSQEALTTLPDSASRQILYSLAEYVVERKR